MSKSARKPSPSSTKVFDKSHVGRQVYYIPRNHRMRKAAWEEQDRSKQILGTIHSVDERGNVTVILKGTLGPTQPLMLDPKRVELVDGDHHGDGEASLSSTPG